MLLTKVDSLNYKIDVTLNTTDDKKYWFAVYRSEDEIYNPDSDKIIDLIFDDQNFSYNDNIIKYF